MILKGENANIMIFLRNKIRNKCGVDSFSYNWWMFSILVCLLVCGYALCGVLPVGRVRGIASSNEKMWN